MCYIKKVALPYLPFFKNYLNRSTSVAEDSNRYLLSGTTCTTLAKAFFLFFFFLFEILYFSLDTVMYLPSEFLRMSTPFHKVTVKSPPPTEKKPLVVLLQDVRELIKWRRLFQLW